MGQLRFLKGLLEGFLKGSIRGLGFRVYLEDPGT